MQLAVCSIEARASRGLLCTQGWLSEAASPCHSCCPLPRAQVNNAGVVTLGPATEVPLEAARQCFESNVFGLLELCQVSSAHRLAHIPRTCICCSRHVSLKPTCDLASAPSPDTLRQTAARDAVNSFKRCLNSCRGFVKGAPEAPDQTCDLPSCVQLWLTAGRVPCDGKPRVGQDHKCWQPDRLSACAPQVMVLMMAGAVSGQLWSAAAGFCQKAQNTQHVHVPTHVVQQSATPLLPPIGRQTRPTHLPHSAGD